MAYKLVFLALNLVCFVHSSEVNDLCNCDPSDVKSNALLWKFLKALSVDVPDEDINMYAVLPGQLSPLVTCGCGEVRKKRDLVPIDGVQEKVRLKRSLRYNGVCPKGTVLYFGRVCITKHVEDTDMYDYDSSYSD